MSDVYLPILKDTKDPHYRYKMPKLTAKIEGSGNGIKTVITNMVAVAKSIGRPPAYPTKYFGCELGAQVTIANDLFIVNGSHDTDKLVNLLYSFIKKFVLCQKCSNPETTLTIVKQNISQKCIACGHETTIPKAIHKLTTFIINHPPDATGPHTSKNGKVSSKSDKKSGKKGHSSSPTNTTTTTTTNGNQKTEFLNGQDQDEDAFDEEEFSTRAYAERMRELTDGFSNNIYMSDAKENANIFYSLVKEKKEAGQLLDANVQKELVKEAERLDIKDKATLILSELIFTENMIAEIKVNRLLLLRFCYQNRRAQKYLLGGFEKLVGDVYKEKLFANALAILKAFYDEDILEEESIIEWASKESKKYVGKEMSRKIHEKVGPFIKWLKEAEEGEESEEEEEEDAKSNSSTERKDNSSAKKNEKAKDEQEEEEEEDEEVQFSHRVQGISIIDEVKPVVLQASGNGVAVNATNGDEGVDDLCIDDI